ncbi:MAG: CBS domain-containing protein [Flavobacteriaceae bacterium]|uniref:CBS domain-containing protein n=1 Tax=Flagellimonas algarum TaxID=3230298 RepID=UPI00339188D2|nr:CBS domain-containing protein [Flavobacteriaceae bacterium]
MHIQNHILDSIPVFEVSEPLEKVIQFFDESTFSHIAVTENGFFLGLLTAEDLACFEAEKTIEEFRYELESFFVTTETSWLDVLEKFARNEANLLPVLNDSNRVMGYYDLNDIVALFIGTPFFTEPGGIVVVAKGIKDYSFSEISQIVESNNSRLIGAFITESQNDVVQITVKIGGSNLNEVIQTFRRYNYTILFGNNDDQFIEDLKQRSDYLDKYLNV